MANGCKGEPKFPFQLFSWQTKSGRARAKSKMNKKQRACMWLGDICTVVGIISLAIGVVWYIVQDITGELRVALPHYIVLVGLLIIFAGVVIVRISIPKDTQNEALLENKQEE